MAKSCPSSCWMPPKAELLLLFCQIIWLFESWCRYGWLGSLKLEWLSQNLNVCLKSSTSHISNTPISFLATSVYSSYFKVQILCEGEKNWKKFVFFFRLLSIVKPKWEVFSNLYDHFRMSELYKELMLKNSNLLLY